VELKKWLMSGKGCIAVGTGLTLIVLAESIFPPWAPYFIVYAILAICIPLVLGTYRFGSFQAALKSNWRLILGIFVIAVILNEGVFVWLYERILTELGLSGNPFYSMNATMNILSNKAAAKFGISQDSAMMLYALFIVIWAPIGEELLYRGYIQGILRQFNNFKASALVSAAFFGIRHVTHEFFLWPDIPWIAAGTWSLSAFIFGLLMSCLYERTRSLYPLILVHLAVNLIDIVMSL
jgi:membrane protease YdiL (CAAX protease family)